MKVLPLKGFRSLRALNVFATLVLGLKMLPAYQSQGFEEFYAAISLMPPHDQEKLLREAAMFVELQKEEVEAIVCFCTDANGVPYGPNNLANLKPDEILEMIVAVAMEIAKIKIDLVTEDEKKNLATTL